MGVGPSTGAWSTYQGSHPKENRFYVPQKPLAINSSSVRRRDPRAPPSMLECWLTWSREGLVQAATTAMSSWEQWPCHAQDTVLLQSPLTSGSNNLSVPSFLMVPKAWREDNTDAPLVGSTPQILRNFWLQENFNNCFWLQVTQTNVSEKWKGFESLWRTKDTYGNYH